MTNLARKLPWIAALVTLVIHLIANPHYGFFRDELYFIMCGFRPQFGYVDQPPLVPLLAAGSQLFGHSLFLLRAVPALFAAAGAYVTCLLVIEFEGGVLAQSLASLVYLCTAVLLSFGMKASTDEVNLLTWPLLAYLVLRITKGADRRWWLVAGAVAGITIESKYSVLFFLVALVAGLAVTPERRIMWNRWFATGCAIALAIALPNFLWQAHYGFPMLEVLRAGQNGKNVIAGPLLFIVQQFLITNLFLFPLWIAGAIWLFTKPAFRFLGFTYVLLIAEMMLSHGKHYYPAAVYPIVIAAGAVAFEAWTSQVRPLRFVIMAYTLLLGPIFVPFSLPILSETGFIAYEGHVEDALHIPKTALATEHNRETVALPGDYADMHGWPELAATIQRIYNGLPASEKAQAVVSTSNYGETAAIEFFAPGVPVIGYHNQYWLWGTHGYSGNVVIDINGDCGADAHLFRSSKQIATFNAPYTIGWETNVPIMLCKGIKVPIATFWPSVKKYE